MGGRYRCRYYVNTNFVVDLGRGGYHAMIFARRYRGLLCTSSILVYEFRRAGRGSWCRDLLRRHSISIIRVPVLKYYRRALEVLRDLGVKRPSENTVFDTAHILVCLDHGLVFVTSDKRSCNRAIRLGVECIMYREVVDL